MYIYKYIYIYMLYLRFAAQHGAAREDGSWRRRCTARSTLRRKKTWRAATLLCAA